MATVVLAAVLALARRTGCPGAPEPTTWLCLPGQEPNPCAGDQTTTVYSPDGTSKTTTPKVPEDPKVDCFYVYPTVSDQPTQNANKNPDPPVSAIAKYQAQRFSQICKVYAPLYRQRTITGIFNPTTNSAEAGGDRLRRRAPGLARLPGHLQQGPRRGADRPQPGHVPPAQADRRGGRDEAGPAGEADLGPAARRQRAGARRARPPAATSSARRRARAAPRPAAWWPTRPTTAPRPTTRALASTRRRRASPTTRRCCARTRRRWRAGRRR